MALFFISMNKLFLTLLNKKDGYNVVLLQGHIKHILKVVRIIFNGDRFPLYLTKTLATVDIPSVRGELKSHHLDHSYALPV